MKFRRTAFAILSTFAFTTLAHGQISERPSFLEAAVFVKTGAIPCSKGSNRFCWFFETDGKPDPMVAGHFWTKDDDSCVLYQTDRPGQTDQFRRIDFSQWPSPRTVGRIYVGNSPSQGLTLRGGALCTIWADGKSQCHSAVEIYTPRQLRALDYIRANFCPGLPEPPPPPPQPKTAY